MLMPAVETEALGGSHCLFDQPWWLETVRPGRWDAVEVRHGEQLVARWPFTVERRCGMTVLGMPPYTPVLGPWTLDEGGKYVTRLSREKELLNELIDRLPPFDYLSQRMHPSMRNWLPFHWRNWSQTTRYTYVLDRIGDTDALWDAMRDNIRREIRKARKRLEVRAEDSMDEVIRLMELTYGRQGRTAPIDRALLERIAGTCATRGSGKALVAVDSSGRPHAAVYVVWDRRCAYYLLGGADPRLRNSGAHSLVLWHAIALAANVTDRFDFEGSMVESIERFFRSFGARQTPYLKISRCNSKLMRAALALRQALAG